MALGGNANHPARGSKIKVDPIVATEDVRKVLDGIKNPMHRALFVTGTNTNLRASDLTRLTAGEVRHLKPMDHIEIREKKTGKLRKVTFNGKSLALLQDLGRGLTDGDRLFPLTVPSVHRLVKGWCRRAGLNGNFGSHTMRKTWGYHQRVTFGVGLPQLMECFNHSSQGQTLEYLCIQPEEIRNIYANEI